MCSVASETSREAFKEQIARIAEQVGIPEHKAFPRWVCQNILGIEDAAEIDEAVSIGGRGSFGVDAFYAEDGDAYDRYACWIRVTYDNGLDRRTTREEIESFAHTLGHLRRCPAEANAVFRQKSAEFAMMEGRQPRIRKRMVFVTAGRIGAQVRDMLKDSKWREDKLGPGPDVRLEVLDIDNILSWVTSQHTPALQISFDGGTIDRTDEAGKKSAVGHISASLLAHLAKEHKEALFLNPPRTVSGPAPTHKAIRNTISNDKARSKFWKLNNGITAVCTKLEKADGAYNVENFKIVNGHQTMYALENSTYPIEGVFVLLSIHETADTEERNQISDAVNTQNPIKPSDLVTNYKEMTDLALQCKDFPEFYFEHQTNGFLFATAAVQNRVTDRRVMRKAAVARAYCAYALSPHDAIVPDRVMFSLDNWYYDRIFKDRTIKEFMIPHIFMHLLGDLHRKWCRELQDDPSDDAARNKGMISKDPIKYYILKFISESMIKMDETVRASVEESLIESFRGLKRDDKIPKELTSIAQAAYDSFMVSFDANRKETWPAELIKKIESPKYRETKDDVPSPYDVMDVLCERGNTLLPQLLRTRAYMYRQLGGDPVQSKLREIVC